MFDVVLISHYQVSFVSVVSGIGRHEGFDCIGVAEIRVLVQNGEAFAYVPDCVVCSSALLEFP